MPSKTQLPVVPVIGALLIAAGCVSGSGTQTVKVLPPPAPPIAAPIPAPEPTPDPVAILISTSDKYFEAGRKELAVGHLLSAKAEFDRALDTLLESPDGARSDARLREHFDRLVDRISVLEQAALTTGDGFSETKSEPAAIDALLAIETFESAAPRAATAEAVQADLESTTHDIPIPTNDRVLRYVELFQGRLREFLNEGLSRGAQYLPMIQSTFRAEGLPLDLAYIPLIESAFKPSALSRAKARGVWQFMRGTALENGLRSDWYLDERADPNKATQAAAKYLKTLYGMFEDWHLAMASYNGGPGRVKRALTRSKKIDFWSVSATTRYLPRETRDYVPMILAAMIIAKNPSQYGFDFAPEAPLAYEKVRLLDEARTGRAELERMMKSRSRLMRGFSHDVKNPLGAADGYAELLTAGIYGALSAEQHERVMCIRRSIRVALALIDDLHALARAEVGRRQALL